jgi:hypothetical protein
MVRHSRNFRSGKHAFEKFLVRILDVVPASLRDFVSFLSSSYNITGQ